MDHGEAWQEELPHAQGQGHQSAMAQEQLRGAIPCLMSGVAAKRSYPKSEVKGSGQEELPHV